MYILYFIIQLLNGYVFVQSLSIYRQKPSFDIILVSIVSMFLFVFISTLYLNEYLVEAILFDVIFIVTVFLNEIPVHRWITNKYKLYFLLVFNLFLLIAV